MEDIEIRKKERIPFIDVAKGILIILLVYGHINVLAGNSGFDDIILTNITRSMPLYSCFFMQSFFIITGLCSSFSQKFGSFLWKNLKTLIIPAIILSLINAYIIILVKGSRLSFDPVLNICQWFFSEKSGPWFIFALFWSKLLLWAILKCKMWIQIVIVCLLLGIGLWLNRINNVPEIQWYLHTLIILPFLYIGCLLKGNIDRYSSILMKAAYLAIPVIVIERILEYVCNFPMPIVDFNLGIDFVSLPIHFVNVLLGSSFIFYVSKKLQDSKFLSIYGKGTLLIYLMNEAVIISVLLLLKPFYNNTNVLFCLLFYVGVFTLCLAFFYLLIKIIYNTPQLSWIVGKW